MTDRTFREWVAGREEAELTRPDEEVSTTTRERRHQEAIAAMQATISRVNQGAGGASGRLRARPAVTRSIEGDVIHEVEGILRQFFRDRDEGRGNVDDLALELQAVAYRLGGNDLIQEIKMIVFIDKTQRPCQDLKEKLDKYKIKCTFVDINSKKGAILAREAGIRAVPAFEMDTIKGKKYMFGNASVDQVREFMAEKGVVKG